MKPPKSLLRDVSLGPSGATLLQLRRTGDRVVGSQRSLPAQTCSSQKVMNMVFAPDPGILARILRLARRDSAKHWAGPKLMASKCELGLVRLMLP